MPNSAKSSNPGPSSLHRDVVPCLFLHLALPLGDPAISSTISVYRLFTMAIWTSSEHGEEDTVSAETPSLSV